MQRLLVFVLLGFLWAATAHPGEAPFNEADISAGKFLVASDYHMSDPKFQTSVVLLVHHDKNGTLGLILNHATKMNVHEALPRITDLQHAAGKVYIGGPVAPQGFMMLVRTNESSDGLIRVMDNVSFSADMDSMAKWLGRESRPNHVRIFAGYSGWAAGQLAFECLRHGWRILPANAKQVFDTDPEILWQELAGEETGIRTSIPSGSPDLRSGGLRFETSGIHGLPQWLPRSSMK